MRVLSEVEERYRKKGIEGTKLSRVISLFIRNVKIGIQFHMWNDMSFWSRLVWEEGFLDFFIFSYYNIII
ncbi:hypothetical protein BREVNS_0710 [Brevinematales bacterium NS]|nr:hypothetical protein BREVNS_0710 [Brevinematales bacterium NS]